MSVTEGGVTATVPLTTHGPTDKKALIERMSIPVTGTIRQAMQAIERGALGTALVCDSETDRFQSVLTDGDIRRALLGGLGLEAPVSLVESPASLTGRVGMKPEEIAALFSAQVRVVPILDESGRVADLAMFDKRAFLPIAQPLLGERELMYVTECVLTGWVSSAGRFVTKFEEQFAEFCGVPYAVAMSNGTTALHAALLALDIGPGDEVIVPTLSFIASANAVMYTGARPVFVDSEPVTWNLDVAAVERAITPKTKAVMAVHLYGHPADMDALTTLCRDRGITLIEDAAEAHGARFGGKRVGSFGDVSAFSFYGNKIVTTGEGGMVVTSKREIAERVRMLRDHGMSPQKRYWHPVLGYNYRMTNLQAALGVAQMEKIDAILAAKREIAWTYADRLRGIPGIQLPAEVPPAESVFWLYSIIVDAEEFGMTRDDLMVALKSSNIETRPLFHPIHHQPIYATGQRLAVAEDLSARGMSLPSDASLSHSEIEAVAEAIRGAYKGRA